jgi:hypothetical protein
MPKSALRVASSAPPGRTQVRQTLASAIELRDAAEKRLADLKKAGERLADEFYACYAAADAAKEALAEAKSAESRRVVAEVLGESVDGPSVSEAAAQLERAEREITRLRRARAAIADEEIAAGREFDRARSNVKIRVRDVLRADAAVARLRHELQAAQKIFAELRAAAEVVRPMCAVAGERVELSWCPEIAERELTGAQLWREAVAALERDADASLPT